MPRIYNKQPRLGKKKIRVVKVVQEKSKACILTAKISRHAMNVFNALQYTAETPNGALVEDILYTIDGCIRSGNGVKLRELFGHAFDVNYVQNYMDNLALIESALKFLNSTAGSPEESEEKVKGEKRQIYTSLKDPSVVHFDDNSIDGMINDMNEHKRKS